MSHGGPEVPHEVESHDPFTKKVALCVAIYAVVLAVAGTGGKNAGKDMLKEQIAASDLQISAANEWSQYQAKTVRESESENTLRDHEILALTDLTPAAREKLAKADGELQKKLAGYKADKEKLRDQARKYEKDREDALTRSHTAHVMDSYFDYAELLIQLAIVLASVTMLSGARWPFFTSLVLVAAGLILTVNGYTLLFHLPFIEGH
jgi:hypothetical protein